MIELTSWQTTFVALGAPQLFVALAFHLTVPSAKPLQSNAAASDFFGDVARLAQLQTLQALFCASFFSTINGAMDKFLPSFYVRVHHMGIAEVGTWLGIGTGIVAGCGGLIGGRVIDTVYQRRKDPSVSLGL
jgi:predicted MFS family arabinose efflux permease